MTAVWKLASVGLLAAAALGITGCQEKRTFVPLAPSEFRDRVLAALPTYPYKYEYSLNPGRFGSVFSTQNVAGLWKTHVLVVDWTSAANRITVAVHHTGNVRVDGFEWTTEPFDCFVPSNLQSIPGGMLLTAPRPRPLCGTVLSDTSNDKPKVLDLRDLPTGAYEFLATSEGPANETLSVAYIVE